MERPSSYVVSWNLVFFLLSDGAGFVLPYQYDGTTSYIFNIRTFHFLEHCFVTLTLPHIWWVARRTHRMYTYVCGLLPQKAQSGISKEKRHEAESMRGEVWSGISEGRGPTGAGQVDSSQDPACDTQGTCCLSRPRAIAASAGVQPYLHLNLSLGFALGADDIACCVHDWLWLLKLQPHKKR